MLESLAFKNVGPASEMSIEFKSRMNLLTGGNDLGKSFILDAAWWALTNNFAKRIVPHLPPSHPEISFSYTNATKGSYEYTSRFDREEDLWTVNNGRPLISGLVLYAKTDGGFAVWDPTRNYCKDDSLKRPNAYVFTPNDVWNRSRHCEGLLRDWASWQREGSSAFSDLNAVMAALSPSLEEQLKPGDLRKISIHDSLRYPTLRMRYGQDVPIIHVSAGMRRIATIAYLLVWSWYEHLEACRYLGNRPVKEIILLVDEIEAHLHHQWQRRIVPALLGVMNAMTFGERFKDIVADGEGISVQLIAATHSPFVMTSIDPSFNEDIDGVFHLELIDDEVELRQIPWYKQVDVMNLLAEQHHRCPNTYPWVGDDAPGFANGMLTPCKKEEGHDGPCADIVCVLDTVRKQKDA